ncbi:MAG: M15 family metallopeptidase [Candidatus Berkiella sp.]
MDKTPVPQGFVVLSQAVPDLLIDLKYCYDDNLLGRPLAGYAPDGLAVVTRECALALKEIAKALTDVKLLKAFNVKAPKLMVLEAYRPQMAGDDFWEWSQSDCQKTKEAYYPNVNKADFFELGYIVRRSSHTRGSTVDVTLVDTHRAQYRHVDFGTPFDFMDELSHPANQGVSAEAFNNRQRLKNLMNEFGFKGIDQEWWHFTLENEPFPDTYFNFPVINYAA